MEIVFRPVRRHEATLIFLHGFGMSASDMACDLAAVAAELPWLRVVVPEAPMQPVTAYGGDENRSWFDYLNDREGEAENAVDTQSVRRARSGIQRIVWREHATAPPNVPIILGGLSQGGCLALDVASRDASLAAVVTCVAHRLYVSCARPLLCPWYALIASDDDVFPSSWAAPAPQDHAHVTVAEGADHYLSKGELAPFVMKSVRSILGTGVVVTTTPEQEQVLLGP
jgi:pimeloyl-ACP methyl ester carboxylesterase